MTSDLRAPAAIARDDCDRHVGRPRSSFTSRGRGGVTQDPDAALPALYLAGRDIDLAPARVAVAGRFPRRPWRR